MVLEFTNDYNTFKTFSESLKNIGVELETSYIAEKYIGNSITLDYQLCLNNGLFSKKVLMLGANREELESVGSYINNVPAHKDWRLSVRSKSSNVETGSFELVEKMRYKGTEKAEGDVSEIVKNLGGNETDIDYILNRIEKKVLGYFPSSSSEEVQKDAAIIHKGATTPISHDEMISFLEDMKKGADHAVTMGDESSESFTKIWGKLLDYWRNKPKS